MLNGFYRNYGKRLFDVAVALPALILLLPVFAVISLLVRIYLGSPVLFSQHRPGLEGKLFKILKFRSMTDARDSSGKMLDDDKRLGQFGKILRASSLDELPELWNVVVGQMSLVGPRPLKVHYLPMYSAEQAERHRVKPGITGWAQVNGRNSISWDERFELDRWYVAHLSFGRDLYILWKTVAAVFGRKGITAEGHVSTPDFEGNKQIVVIGAGGHGKIVLSTLQAAGVVVDAVYDDNRELWGTSILGVPVRGPVAELKQASGKIAGMLGIGDSATRQRLAESLSIEWLTAIHPRPIVDPSVNLGSGTVVVAGAVLQPEVTIGEHAIVDTLVSIDQGCQIGNYVLFGPGSHLLKDVWVGDRSFLGTGCSVLPRVHIEADVTVREGVVVTCDLPRGCTVARTQPSDVPSIKQRMSA